MNLVVDENVSFSIVEDLRRQGHNVVAICETSGVPLSDEAIYELVKRHNAILITRDHHFKNTLRFPTEHTEGIIYLREGNITSAEEADTLKRSFAKYKADRIKGKFITLHKGVISIRA